MTKKNIVQCPKCGYDVLEGQEEYCFNCAMNGDKK